MSKSPPDIADEPRFQRRFWKLERVAWAAFGLIIVVALAGMTGAGGPVARQSVELTSGKIVAPRVSRWSSADQLQFHLRDAEELPTLTLSSDFSQFFQIEDIQPEPVQMTLTPEAYSMQFLSGGGKVVVHVRVDRPGIASYSVALNGSNPVAISTIILP